MHQEIPYFLRERNAAVLRQGVAAWNEWREANPGIRPDLTETDLRGLDLGCENDADIESENSYDEDPDVIDLSGVRLFGARLEGANLRRANLAGADLEQAQLCAANLQRADLSNANLERANLNRSILSQSKLYRARLVDATLRNARLFLSDLREADLEGADCTEADLSSADLEGSNLRSACLQRARLEYARVNFARFVNTNLCGADLTGAVAYGIAAWGLDLRHAKQSDIVITPREEAQVAVDDLEVAQFVYLLLKNEKIRNVIETVSNKAVLILGRFTERKEVLELIRRLVRKHELLPVVFDFDRPVERDFTETVMTLAGLSRFIIADITSPRSVPLELQATIPNYMVPFVPILAKGERSFAMFDDLWHKHRDWVLDPLIYDSVETLERVFGRAILEPANQRVKLLQARKAEQLRVRRAEEYL